MHIFANLKQHKMKTITASAKGITITYQNTGNSSFIEYEADVRSSETSPLIDSAKTYNPVQQNMMNRVLKGLDYYSANDLKGIPRVVQKAIVADHSKATFAIRKLKVNRYYRMENKLLNAIFPNMKIGSRIIDYYVGCNQAVSKGFAELKIEIDEVVAALVSQRLLPKDFDSISIENTTLKL